LNSGNIELRDSRLEQVIENGELERVATGFQFTEGPVWDERRGTLIFSDMAGNCMYRLEPGGRLTVYRCPSNKANGNVLDRRLGLVSCEHVTSRVVCEQPDGTIVTLASSYEGSDLNSPNDVIVSRNGSVIFSDPTFGRQAFFGVEREPAQLVRGVYSVDPSSGSITRLRDDFDQPNGLCLSDDEEYLFVNDTGRMHIRRFRYGAGPLDKGEIWADVVGEGDGAPDGMKLDSRGNLFCTGPGGVHVFAQDGCCLGVIRIPEGVANFEWGDDDRKSLYLCATTSVYRVRTRVPGRRLG
jgi:gluconolactonase